MLYLFVFVINKFCNYICICVVKMLYLHFYLYFQAAALIAEGVSRISLQQSSVHRIRLGSDVIHRSSAEKLHHLHIAV